MTYFKVLLCFVVLFDMKESFYTKLDELISRKGGLTSRNLIMEESRYEEIISEVKEAKEKRKKGLSLTSKEYRRINRFDVMSIGDTEMLIEKTTREISGKLLLSY